MISQLCAYAERYRLGNYIQDNKTYMLMYVRPFMCVCVSLMTACVYPATCLSDLHMSAYEWNRLYINK